MWKRSAAFLMLTLLLAYQPIGQVRASPISLSLEGTLIVEWDPPKPE